MLINGFSALGQPAIVGANVWELVLNSSTFALLVLTILLVLSIISWAVILFKWRSYRRVLGHSARIRVIFRKGRRLSERISALSALGDLPQWRLVDAGLREASSFTEQNRGAPSRPEAGYDLTPEQKRAVSDTLERVTQEEITRLEEWTILLATTANVSPFLGLLGTCWGIMNAFVGIGATGSASLVVVAPGIAEALIATVVGLAAAIPAVVAYNWCVRKLREIGDDLSGLSLEFLTELTRENVRETANLSRPF
ncbi:MAG: MotA/TolQ/ExbB proton channel family protein [candidate division Zixibacteria bacterium]|nr:MotA/TolQ/ExbB proton channel family protein [candidate division Zixibacteria bacterium]